MIIHTCSSDGDAASLRVRTLNFVRCNTHENEIRAAWVFSKENGRKVDLFRFSDFSDLFSKWEESSPVQIFSIYYFAYTNLNVND